MNDDERATSAALASLLHATEALSRWGLALSCMAILLLALTRRPLALWPVTGFAVVILLGAWECYYAFRMRFDAGLFDSMSRNALASLEAVDKAIAAVGLRPPRGRQAERPFADRVRGTRRLIRHHALVVTGQSILFLLAILQQRVT